MNFFKVKNYILRSGKTWDLDPYQERREMEGRNENLTAGMNRLRLERSYF